MIASKRWDDVICLWIIFEWLNRCDRQHSTHHLSGGAVVCKHRVVFLWKAMNIRWCNPRNYVLLQIFWYGQFPVELHRCGLSYSYYFDFEYCLASTVVRMLDCVFAHMFNHFNQFPYIEQSFPWWWEWEVGDTVFGNIFCFVKNEFCFFSKLMCFVSLVNCYFHWTCIWCIRIILWRGSTAVLSIGQWTDLCRSMLNVETLTTYRIDCGVMSVNQSEHVDDKILLMFF